MTSEGSMVVPGLDATKEEVHRFSEVFLARGCATHNLAYRVRPQVADRVVAQLARTDGRRP